MSLFGLWSITLSLPAVVAQTAGDTESQVGISAAVAGIIAESAPRNDSVLTDAPELLELIFGEQVRLVKLVLYNEKKDWVDISFRYNPQPADDFSWKMPALEPSAYYTADWAILSDREQLVRGSFSFTFGAEAELPSILKERERLLLETRNSLPGIRELQRLSLDPAEIIINDDPRPKFEPPFAPVLN